MTHLGIAAQVYSLRDMAQEDFAGTMRALKECGYQGVELAGLYGLAPETVRDCLRELELVPVSAHVPLVDFFGDMKGTVKGYHVIGCRYIAIPWLPLQQLYGGSEFEETRRLLTKASARVAKYGMELLYHNHTHEFQTATDGTPVLDGFFGAFDGGVLQAEPDLCWAKVAGADPETLLRRYRDRCPVVHMKDYRMEGDTVLLTALGEGVQDVPALVRTAGECGAKWLVAEQDDHPFGTPLENMKKSFRCLCEA